MKKFGISFYFFIYRMDRKELFAILSNYWFWQSWHSHSSRVWISETHRVWNHWIGHVASSHFTILLPSSRLRQKHHKISAWKKNVVENRKTTIFAICWNVPWVLCALWSVRFARRIMNSLFRRRRVRRGSLICCGWVNAIFITAWTERVTSES